MVADATLANGRPAYLISHGGKQTHAPPLELGGAGAAVILAPVLVAANDRWSGPLGAPAARQAEGSADHLMTGL